MNVCGSRYAGTILKSVLAFILLLVGTALAHADPKKVVIITWRGETPAETAFKQQLIDLGVDVAFEEFDAGRDDENLIKYLRDHRENIADADLIYSFGTTATLTARNFIDSSLPHVFNIVSDPVGVGLAESLVKPLKGVTGAKLSLSPDAVLEQLQTIYPYKKIGILYDPREENSIVMSSAIVEFAKRKGIEMALLRFSPDGNEPEKQIATLKQQMAGLDLVYTTAASSFYIHADRLSDFIPADMVSVASSTAYVDKGITLAVGTDYGERGIAAAKLAAEILLNNTAPESLPINEVDPATVTFFINRESGAAKKFDLQAAKNPIVYKGAAQSQ